MTVNDLKLKSTCSLIILNATIVHRQAAHTALYDAPRDEADSSQQQLTCIVEV